MKNIFKYLLLLFISVLLFSCSFEAKNNKIGVNDLHFKEKSISLKVGETKTIYINYGPSNATDVNIEYSCSSKEIIQLSGKSKKGCTVTALSSGSAIIIAKCNGYTSYIEVMVKDDSQIIDPYIVIPYVSVGINRGQRKTIIASLYGGNASENALFEWKTDSNIITINKINNSCIIEAKNYGVAKVTVSHPRAKYEASFVVYVSEASRPLFYLTTQSNVIKTYKDSNKKTDLYIDIVGGDESDKSLVTFDVIEGQDNIVISSNNNICSIKAIKKGRAVIKASHVKAKEAVYVTVLIFERNNINYIETSNDFFILNGKETVDFTASLVGDNIPKDVNSKYTYSVDKPEIIDIEQSNNYFRVTAKKDGKSKIIISNPYSNYKKEVLFIIENSNLVNTKCYITVDKPILQLEMGREGEKIKINLIGGVKNDANSFSYKVEDSSIIEVSGIEEKKDETSLSRSVVIKTSNEKAEREILVTPKSCGITSIEVYNTKSMYSTKITVKVFPKGTFDNKKVYIKGDPYVKLLKGDTYNYQCNIENDIGTISSLDYKVQDDNIVSVVSSGLNGVFKAKEKGITNVTISSAFAKNRQNCTVIVCDTEEEKNKCNIIYTDKTFTKMELNTFSYTLLNTLKEIDTSKYEVSVNDKENIEARISGNTLIMYAKKEGTSTVMITHKDIPSFTLILHVEIVNSKIDINYPYSIKAPSFFNVVKGSSSSFNIDLGCSSLKEYEDLSIITEENSSLTFSRKDNVVTVYTPKDTKNKTARLLIEHPKCQESKCIYIYIADTEEEKNNKVILYSDKTNFITRVNDTLCLSLICNKEDQIDNLHWAVSDADKINIDISKNYAIVKALHEGFTKVSVTTPDGFCLNFFITIKNEDIEKQNIYDINLPSIIELLTDESVILKMNYSNIDNITLQDTLWQSDNKDLTVKGNNDECYIICSKKGNYNITVENKKLSYKKIIPVYVKDNVEDFKNTYLISVKNSLLNINKNETKEVNVIFGKNDLPPIFYEDFKWESDTKDIIKIINNGKSALISGVNEGSCKVTVSNCHCDSSYTFEVNVKNDTDKKDVIFITDKILKMKKGDTKTFKYCILDNLNNKDVTQFSDTQIESIDNNNISASIISGALRIKAIENGNATIKLYSNRYKTSTSLMVSVKNSDEENENSFIVTSEKDHYLLKENENVKISLITQNNDSNKINDLKISIDNPNIISVLNNKNILDVKALKNGKAILSVISGNDIYKIYFFVKKENEEFSKDSDIKTQSIINLIDKDEYKSQIISNSFVTLKDYDSDILDVSLYENLLTIKPKAYKSSYIYLGENKESCILVNVFENEDEMKNYKGFNIDKRYFVLNDKETVVIKPLCIPLSFDFSTVKITDEYNNNVAKCTNKDGLIYIKAINPGIAKFKIFSKTQSFFIYVEVKEKKSEGNIIKNNIHYLYTNENPVYIDYINQEKVLIAYASLGFDKKDSFSWKTSDSSLLSINSFENICNIVSKKDEGECFVTCSSPFANNVLTFKVIVGKGFKNNGEKVKYLSSSKNTVSMTYGTQGEVIKISLNNILDASKISFSNSKNNIVKTNGYVSGNSYFINLKPKSCGYGRLTIKHPDTDNLYIDYIVNDDEKSNIVYLTTSDNFSFIKKGSHKPIFAQLKNFEELNAENFTWHNDNPNICTVMGSGNSVKIYGKQNGNAKITLSHPKSENSLTFNIEVSDCDKNIKYITTSSNIIETKVSCSMDSFNVSMVGNENCNNNFEYKVTDPSVLSIVANNDTCYYRGLKEGSSKIIITNTKEADVLPLTVNVIVEKDTPSHCYLTSDSTLNYLSPFGVSKTITIKANNIPSFDSSKLNWYIYSEKLTTDKDGKVINMTASHDKCVIKPLNEGVAKIRAVYTPLNIKMNIMVYVSSFGKIEFQKRSITIFEDETQFTPINVPSFSDNMNSFISYSSDNPSVCSVFGSSKVACISGLKEGTAIVKAHNSYDNSTSEIAVKVLKKDDIHYPKIIADRSCILLNPRDKKQYISAEIIGKGLNDSDNDNLEWSVEGNKSITLYPSKGSKVMLQLDKINGKVLEGDATISITHKKCNKNYKKTIFVSVEELQNYFTLDAYSSEINSNETTQIKANIAGASFIDYENVLWSIDGTKTEADGSTTSIAKIINNSGESCTVLGLSEGTCTLTAFYNGDIQQCTIHIKGDRYFSLVNNSLTLYPGQEYTLHYNLRPTTYSPSWYSSDTYSNDKIIDYTINPDSQTVTLKALKTGKVTLNGICNGIGTVICNIDVVYNPKLLDKSRTSGRVFIPLYDKDTKKYNETKNSKEINFLCYPPIYYVKAEVKSAKGKFDDKIKIDISQNHNNEENDNKAGLGKMTIYSTTELPNDDITVILKQYKDKQCKHPVLGNTLEFKINSYYVDSQGRKDSGFELYFKRHDGSFTLNHVNPNSKDMIKIFDSNRGRITEENSYIADTLNFGESENHFLIFKPKHEGQYFENLQITASSQSIKTDSSCDSKTTDIELKATNFNNEKDNYVSILTSGVNCDVGYDVMYSKEENKIIVPKKSSDDFYGRFAVKKPFWNNMAPISQNEYFPYEVCSSYRNGNKISYDKNVLSCTANNGWTNDFNDQNWSETLFCLKDNDATFYLNERTFEKNTAKLTSSHSIHVAAYILNDQVKKAFFTEGKNKLKIHEGKNEFGKCKGQKKLHFGYHFYWKNTKKDYIVNVKLDQNFSVYDKKNFPYTFKYFSMWKNEDWINSGNGMCLPNLNDNPIENVKLTGEIKLSFNDINGVKTTVIIPSSIMLYDCYRCLYEYNVNTNKFTENKNINKSNPKFLKLK